MTELLLFILGAVLVAVLMFFKRKPAPATRPAQSDTMDDYLEGLIAMQDIDEKRSAMRDLVRAQRGISDPDQAAEQLANVVKLRPDLPAYYPDAFAIKNFTNVCNKMDLKLRQDNSADPDSA